MLTTTSRQRPEAAHKSLVIYTVYIYSFQGNASHDSILEPCLSLIHGRRSLHFHLHLPRHTHTRTHHISSTISCAMYRAATGTLELLRTVVTRTHEQTIARNQCARGDSLLSRLNTRSVDRSLDPYQVRTSGMHSYSLALTACAVSLERGSRSSKLRPEVPEPLPFSPSPLPSTAIVGSYDDDHDHHHDHKHHH